MRRWQILSCAGGRGEVSFDEQMYRVLLLINTITWASYFELAPSCEPAKRRASSARFAFGMHLAEGLLGELSSQTSAFAASDTCFE